MIKRIFYLCCLSVTVLAMDVSKSLLELVELIRRDAAQKKLAQALPEKPTNIITFEKIRYPYARCKYCCSFCGKTVFNRNAHIATHTGAKPYKCLTCGKVFRQSAHLAGHQNSHVPITPQKRNLDDTPHN